MAPIPGLDVLRVLVLGPLLLVIPGFLLLLPIAPAWGWLRRAVVGAGATMSLLVLATWGIHLRWGVPYDARLVWGAYGALLVSAALLAILTRGRWELGRPALDRRAAWLAGIAAFAAVQLYRPHLGYPFPFHVDEWWHLAAGSAIERQAVLDIVDPRLQIGGLVNNPWAAFHLFSLDLKILTGASWLGLYAYGAVLVGVLTVLAAYCSAEREGYGLEAALLVALIPTSLRLLGPQFFVPLGLGLFFIPISFLLFTSAPAKRALPLLAVFVVFLFFAHPQSAGALGILVGTYGLVSMRSGWLKSATLVAIAVVPIVMGRIFLPAATDPERLLDAAPTRLAIPDFLFFYGLIPAALFLVGTYLVLLRPAAERLAWVVTSFAHLVIVALFIVWNIGQPNIYDRAWMHGVLTMSMTAGYVLWRLREWLARQRLPRHAATGAFALFVAALVLTSATAQAGRERDYYKLIDEPTYEDFLWIRDNVDPEGMRALVDPFQGVAFATTTGIPVYAYWPDVHARTDARYGYYQSYFRAIGWLESGGAKDAELQRGNVTLIYTVGSVVNQNFTEAHPNVWVRKETNATS